MSVLEQVEESENEDNKSTVFHDTSFAQQDAERRSASLNDDTLSAKQANRNSSSFPSESLLLAPPARKSIK